MDLETQTIVRQLDEIISILRRIEDRQITVNPEIEDKPISFVPSGRERTGH